GRSGSRPFPARRSSDLAAVAPYDAHVVALPGAEVIAQEAAEALAAAGLEVLLDDRDLRAGEKFADADLLGCPTRITAGRKSLERSEEHTSELQSRVDLV